MEKAVRTSPMFGDVYLVNFVGEGSTQRGLRPAVIFQNNTGNRFSPNVTVLPMTSAIKKQNQVTHVFVPADGTGLKVDSMVLCENPVCIPKYELGNYLTSLPEKYMSEIAEASLLASSAVAYLNGERLASVRRRAEKLNATCA